MGTLWRSFVAVGLLLLVTGCANREAYGVIGDEGDVFTGQMTGSDGNGRIELDDGKGTRCVGDYSSSGSSTSSRLANSDSGLIGLVGAAVAASTKSPNSGRVLLSCSDGQQALVQFSSLGFSSGYGFGTTNNGRSVKFTYGLSRDESARYLGNRQQTASVPGGGPPSGSGQRIASGTGFFITRQGDLVTNAHVIKGCKSVTVTPFGGSSMSASVVSSDATNDLAVLTTCAASLAVAPLRGGRPVRQGEAVVAYGFPLSGALSSGGVTTSGSVSALAGLRDDTRYLQFSAPTQPGNSGGPLLDMSGAVVGVVTSGLVGRAGGTTPQNVNFALKAEVVRTFLGAVGVNAETSPGGRELSTPDLVERARAFTAFVECKG